MSTMESEIDAVLDPLARATMAAWMESRRPTPRDVTAPSPIGVAPRHAKGSADIECDPDRKALQAAAGLITPWTRGRSCRRRSFRCRRSSWPGRSGR